MLRQAQHERVWVWLEAGHCPLNMLDLAARRCGLQAIGLDRAAGAAPFEGAAGRTSQGCFVCERREGAVADPARPERDQTRMPGAARIPAGNRLHRALGPGEAWAVIHWARHLPGRGLGTTPRLEPAARTDRVGPWREPRARRAGGRLASPAPDPGRRLTYLVCFVKGKAALEQYSISDELTSKGNSNAHSWQFAVSPSLTKIVSHLGHIYALKDKKSESL